MTHVVEPSYLKEQEAEQFAMWLWRNAGVAFAPCKLPHYKIVNGQDYAFAVTRVVDGKLLNVSCYGLEWQYLYWMAWPKNHECYSQEALAVYRQWEKDNPINHEVKNAE